MREIGIGFRWTIGAIAALFAVVIILEIIFHVLGVL